MDGAAVVRRRRSAGRMRIGRKVGQTCDGWLLGFTGFRGDSTGTFERHVDLGDGRRVVDGADLTLVGLAQHSGRKQVQEGHLEHVTGIS